MQSLAELKWKPLFYITSGVTSIPSWPGEYSGDIKFKFKVFKF